MLLSLVYLVALSYHSLHLPTALAAPVPLPRSNVCLHAQVSPTEKIVGSVVTTDGMRSAFSARPEISSVQIFYPFHYSGFSDTHWHLVLIEGWFPSIHTFIALARVNNPQVVVLFYCLDPAYPGMERVLALDVDGFLTNSRGLLGPLRRRRPAMYVPLAADTELMRPDPTVAREYGAVYVGAGSNMLKVKPLLTEMLYRSLPHRLRLHGAHWGHDPRLEEAYKGVLPRGTLHKAYSSAHAVLACTIATQREIGMINNRIFEALSCGNVVISDYSDILNETFGEVLQFVHQPEDIDIVLQQLMDPLHAQDFQRLRDRGRELIISRHTWNHRVLEILDLFSSLKAAVFTSLVTLQRKRSTEIAVRSGTARRPREAFVARSIRPGSPVGSGVSGDSNRGDSCDSDCSGSSIPHLAWVVSDHLTAHLDYLLSVRAAIDNFFADKYVVHEYSTAEWLALLEEAARPSHHSDFDDTSAGAGTGGQEGELSSHALLVISQYSVVVAVMSHLDTLHRGFIAFHQWHRDAYHDTAITVTPTGAHASSSSDGLDRTLQKYLTYLLGVDEEHSRQTLQTFTAEGRDNRGVYLSELFDEILFRDDFERGLVSALEKESYSPMIKYFCGIMEETEEERNTPRQSSFRLRNTAFHNRTCDYPSNTEKMNKYRWQICFGTWKYSSEAVAEVTHTTEPDPADVVNSSSALHNIAICLWSQKMFCTARQRTRYLSPQVNYTLLLVGGALSDWTSTCERLYQEGRVGEESPQDPPSSTSSSSSSCVLDSVPLAQVVHVQHSHVAGIVERLHQATELFFIYDENIPTSILKTETSGVDKTVSSHDKSNDENGNDGDTLPNKNTIHDVIWPLLFGAEFQKSIRLSKQPSAHMSQLIADGAWNRLSLQVQWQRVMDILLTFGSFRTTGEFVANYVNPPLDAVATKAVTGADSSSSFPPPPPPEAPQTPPPSFNPDKLLVFIHFQNFIPGLDGQACFFHDGVMSACRYSRDRYMLDIDLHRLSWSEADWQHAAANSAVTHITKTTTLRIELRGVLYVHYFYVMEESYTFCVPNPFYDSSSGSSSDWNATYSQSVDSAVEVPASPYTQQDCVNGTENPLFDRRLQQQYRDSSTEEGFTVL